MPREIKRLVVVSNRLPVVLQKDEQDNWQVIPGSGGLVTALSPVLRNRGGLWIGWPGVDTDGSAEIAAVMLENDRRSGYRLLPVDLNPTEIEKYYNGFSNEVLWPLFHDMVSLCRFEPEYWPVYKDVNRKFADAIAAYTNPEDYIWVHDYHLLLIASTLKQMNVNRRTGFFLHIPFPPLDGFIKLPWRGDVLHAMLEYDLLGFQTMRDLRNFLECVRLLMPKSRTRGSGAVITLHTPERELRVGAFPISIDFNDFVRRAGQPETQREVERIEGLMPQTKVILGLDRLDYSKGIPLRIRAFGEALATYPELRGNVALFQVVVPSRLDGERYQQLKKEIDRLIGEINGKYSEAGWTPVHYLFRSLTDRELLALYRRSDIALITPLKDGMNLVSKEYCACSLDDNGVLILSEFAGAAAQMRQDALLVNPFDIQGVAAAIHRAFHMDAAERKVHMRRLRRGIQRSNIFHWVDNFLRAAIARTIKDFPRLEDYVPALDTATMQKEVA
ncbi:MAG TPA: trehalose-6-phosphate synthase [bacterium]|jgi:trehalose 6-phosphate synthase